MTFMDNSGSEDREGSAAPFAPFVPLVPFSPMMFSVLVVERDLVGLMTRFTGRCRYRRRGCRDIIKFGRLKSGV